MNQQGNIWAVNSILEHKSKVRLLETILELDSNTAIWTYEIFYIYSKIPLWEKHLNYLNLIEKVTDSKLIVDIQDFQKIISKLANRNKFFSGALIKLFFFLNPKSLNINFIAIPYRYNLDRFIVDNSKFIIISPDFKRVYKPLSDFTFIKFIDIHRYIYNLNFKITDIRYNPLLNPKDEKIIELFDYSLILIMDNKLAITSNYNTNAYYNALQEEIIETLRNFDFSIKYQNLDESTFKEAREVWLVKDNWGIFGRVGFKDYRYIQTELSEKVINKINLRNQLL